MYNWSMLDPALMIFVMLPISLAINVKRRTMLVGFMSIQIVLKLLKGACVTHNALYV